MTVEQFAGVVQMHPKTVYALIAAGKLLGVRRFGRSVRIVLAEAIGAKWQSPELPFPEVEATGSLSKGGEHR